MTQVGRPNDFTRHIELSPQDLREIHFELRRRPEHERCVSNVVFQGEYYACTSLPHEGDAHAMHDARGRTIASWQPIPAHRHSVALLPDPSFDIDCEPIPALGIPEGIAKGWEFTADAFRGLDSVQAYLGVVLLVGRDDTQEFKLDDPEINELEYDALAILAAIAQARAWEEASPS